MGGGPASADVVRASCILTFPEAAREEPVPVDAWYLHAVGLPFLRRLARDRLGDAARVALLMQQRGGADGDADGGRIRYVAVSSQPQLRAALERTFARPETALVLHVVSLDKVAGCRRIHVRPEANPNVSPEPVAPLALVFPALAVDGLMTPTAVRVPAADVAPSELLRQSANSFRKSVDVAPRPPKALDDAVPLVEEREYSWRSATSTSASGSDLGAFSDATPSTASSTSSLGQIPSASDSYSNSSSSSSVVSVVPEASAVSSAPSKSVDSLSDDGPSIQDGLEDSDIPVARVVSAALDDASAPSAAAIPSDYVMLELQNGAGLPEAPPVAASASRFFISANWHLQADEMSASMRLEPLPAAGSSLGSSSLLRQRPGASSLGESFVLLP